MNIKDYLKYYYGGPALEAVIVPGQELSFSDCTINSRTLFNIDKGLFIVKPILRRLEDMTEDEAIELLGITVPYATYHSKDHSGLYWSGAGVSSAHLSFSYGDPRSFHYLLSRGFDLFGLINAGLAIDSKTVTI